MFKLAFYQMFAEGFGIFGHLNVNVIMHAW